MPGGGPVTFGGSPSTSRRSAKIPWSLTRRLSAGTGRRQAGVTDWPLSHVGRVLSCHCGGAGEPWAPSGGGGQAEETDGEGTLHGLSPPPSYVTPGASELRVTGQEALPPCLPRAGSASCPPSPPHPWGGGRAGGPASGRAGPACDPLRFSRERERAWPPWCSCWLCGATLLSGSASGRWGPWGRKQLQAAGSGGARGEEGQRRRPSSPSSWWAPSVAHRRGSGGPSPSSPEPRKSNSLIASSESSSSSSSSVSGARALDGSWGAETSRELRAPAHLLAQSGETSVPACGP